MGFDGFVVGVDLGLLGFEEVVEGSYVILRGIGDVEAEGIVW